MSAVLSVTLEKELFPNTPAAVVVARWVFAGCLLALLPLSIVWLWQVAMHMEHPGWRLLWYLAATGATGIGIGLVLLLLFGLLVWI